MICALLGRLWGGSGPVRSHEGQTMERTVLHNAAIIGDCSTILRLLAERVDKNARDAHGFTPLHYAVTHMHTAAVAILLRGGVDVNAQDLGRMTPLHIAASANSASLVAMLLEYGANRDIVNASGETPVMLHNRYHAGHHNALGVNYLLCHRPVFEDFPPGISPED